MNTVKEQIAFIEIVEENFSVESLHIEFTNSSGDILNWFTQTLYEYQEDSCSGYEVNRTASLLIPCPHSLQGVIEFDTNGDRQNTVVQTAQLRLTDEGERKRNRGRDE